MTHMRLIAAGTLATTLLLAQAGAARATEQGRVVLVCKGTSTFYGQTYPVESGVILDFGKHVVLHNGRAYKMTNVTDTTIAFETVDTWASSQFGISENLWGGLDRVTGKFDMRSMFEPNKAQWVETLTCVPGQQRF
jgi:hypothetical protein